MSSCFATKVPNLLETTIVSNAQTIKNLKIRGKALDEANKKKQKKLEEKETDFNKIKKDTGNLIAVMRKEMEILEGKVKEKGVKLSDVEYINGEMSRDLE